MRKIYLVFLLLLLSASILAGCQSQAATSREAQADLEILKPKPLASAAKTGEDLKEPQPGFEQEPKDEV